jgi:hypothetical protein
MRAALTRLSLVASLILLAPAALQAEGRVRIDPGFGSNPGYSGQGLQPRSHRYIAPAPVRPTIVCDNFGRCFQRSPGRGYVRPPGWAYDSPYRTQVPGRFFRPDDSVVCDQATRICYKHGRIDKTETRDAFGERAADRADDIRDDRGKARLFVPERGVTCDPIRQACYDDGFKDYSLTRRYFGQRAADRLF